jgi:hypothetical protein
MGGLRLSAFDLGVHISMFSPWSWSGYWISCETTGTVQVSMPSTITRISRILAVFIVEDMVELRESYGLKVKELARAQRLTEEYQEIIVEKWHEHLT